VFLPPVSNDSDLNAPTLNQASSGELGLGLPSGETDAPYDSEEAIYHPRFQLPPLDLDILYTQLENEPVPEPTAEELSGYYHFLITALGE
jgi:hypothetical protein